MSRKDDAIRTTYTALFQQQGGMCAACRQMIGFHDGQLAHRIPQRKHLLQRYGEHIVHHPANLAVTHPGQCNDLVSLGGDPGGMAELARSIELQIATEAAQHMAHERLLPYWRPLLPQLYRIMRTIADGGAPE